MKGQLEASQLTRRAFVYVRQSTMAQVLHHQESTMMQYDLRQRALALGWAPEAIEVIDEDQARSGTTTDGRSGFARLAGAVAHGEAGGVFALDVSRMARVVGGLAAPAGAVRRGRGGGGRRAADLRPERPGRQAPLGVEGDDVRSGDPLAAVAPAGGAAAQGAPRGPEDARPDRLPVGRAGLRAGSRRGRAAGRARHLSAVRRRAERVGGGAVGARDGVEGSDATNLGGRGLRGGVEIPRGLAPARHAEEPGLRRRVRVRAPAREDGAGRRTDPTRAPRHA